MKMTVNISRKSFCKPVLPGMKYTMILLRSYLRGLWTWMFWVGI